MAETLEMNLLHQNAEQADEEKYIEHNDNELLFASGSDVKEQQSFEKVHEIELERQLKWRKWNWKPCKVRIIQHSKSVSISIDNDDYFKGCTGKNELELNKCTISFQGDTIDQHKNVVVYLQLLYEDNNTIITTTFRLAQHNRGKDSIKMTLFAATLRFYGSRFNKLKSALKRWDEQGFSNRKLSKAQAIEIFRTKYEYDIFEGRHAMNRYIQMIQNMDEKVIQPLHIVLKLTEFSKKEPEIWRQRCKKALQIDYEWKMLSSQIKVQLDKINQITTRIISSKIKLINYKTIAHCDEIQVILKEISAQCNNFYYDFIAPELVAWREILQKYKDCGDNGVGKHQWKIIAGIFLALFGAAVVIGILCFPPAGAAGGVAMGAAATTGTAAATTGAATTSAAAVSTVGWLGIGCGITGSCVGMGLLGFGFLQYFGLSPDYGIFREVEEVLGLWQKFQKTYLDICEQTNTLGNMDISGGPGSIWDSYMRRLVRNNLMQMNKMSRECMRKIQKIS